MNKTRMCLRHGLPFAVLLAASCLARPGLAEEPGGIEVNLKDHRFTPAEIHVPAGKPAVLIVHNQDSTAEEFDSSALKVEKVIVAGGSGTVRLHALKPGRYPFAGEYHEDTAKGVVISE